MDEMLANSDHTDQNQDIQLICQVVDQKLEPLVTVIQQMLDKIAAMDDEVDGLTKLVNEEIIGGITNLYNTKERLSGISSLQDKYGELMGPYADFYSEMTDGKDIYEQLYEELQEFKQSAADQVDDAAVDAKVKELADMLKSKFDKVHSMAMPTASISVEVAKPEDGSTETEVNPSETEDSGSTEGTDKSSALVDKIRKMKARAGDVKF